MVRWMGRSIALALLPQPPVKLQTGRDRRACMLVKSNSAAGNYRLQVGDDRLLKLEHWADVC